MIVWFGGDCESGKSSQKMGSPALSLASQTNPLQRPPLGASDRLNVDPPEDQSTPRDLGHDGRPRQLRPSRRQKRSAREKRPRPATPGRGQLSTKKRRCDCSPTGDTSTSPFASPYLPEPPVIASANFFASKLNVPAPNMVLPSVNR